MDQGWYCRETFNEDSPIIMTSVFYSIRYWGPYGIQGKTAKKIYLLSWPHSVMLLKPGARMVMRQFFLNFPF